VRTQKDCAQAQRLLLPRHTAAFWVKLLPGSGRARRGLLLELEPCKVGRMCLCAAHPATLGLCQLLSRG